MRNPGLYLQDYAEIPPAAPDPTTRSTPRALFESLRAFEQDLHTHIHLENNILFPRACQLEESVLDSGA